MASGGGVRVRRGRRADLASLVPLSVSADHAEWRVMAAEREAEVLLVATLDDDVVGAVSVRWEMPCDAPHPWLYALRVRPDVRRRGIAAVLIDAAEEAAREHGATALSLDVDRDKDRLLAYYRRLGYETLGPHEHHWRAVDPRTGAVTAEGTADTWLMRRALTA